MIFIDDKEQIIEFVSKRSKDMSNYIKTKSGSKYTLWYKSLTHSDLITKGKRSGSNQPLDRNILYYLSSSEMVQIENESGKQFESAKQSNIGLCEQFYEDLGIPRLERRKGPQKTKHDPIVLNDHIDVCLVNDTLKYFKMKYTKRVLRALDKDDKKWDDDSIELNEDNWFTNIRLTEAIHGLGTSDDKEFHKLRLSMFLNDSIILLIEHNNEKNRLFIMLEKNPRFFELAGISDQAWVKYLETEQEQERNKILSAKPLKTDEDEEMSRKLQSAWKDKLAQEMMNYSAKEGEVFCPITGISADYNSFSMLFIASHIKEHGKCNSMEESYNLYNGILLSAGVDALFDKHMITFDEEKNIVFSFLLEKNYSLQNELLLNHPIFKNILNAQRMEMMKYHREEFYRKEEDRRKKMK